jgi:hypothetical protein
MVDNAEDAAAETSALSERLRDIEREIRESYAKQTDSRKTQHEAVESRLAWHRSPSSPNTLEASHHEYCRSSRWRFANSRHT